MWCAGTGLGVAADATAVTDRAPWLAPLTLTVNFRNAPTVKVGNRHVSAPLNPAGAADRLHPGLVTVRIVGEAKSIVSTTLVAASGPTLVTMTVTLARP